MVFIKNKKIEMVFYRIIEKLSMVFKTWYSRQRILKYKKDSIFFSTGYYYLIVESVKKIYCWKLSNK